MELMKPTHTTAQKIFRKKNQLKKDVQCFRNNLECAKKHKHCTYMQLYILGCRHMLPLHSHKLQITFYKLLLKNAQPTTQNKSGPMGYNCSIYLAAIIINSLTTLLKNDQEYQLIYNTTNIENV